MANILLLSSWVAHGHVGLSAALPVLQAIGHSVSALPTTVYSNHLGWPHSAGMPVPPERLTEMIVALEANGWLDDLDTLLTGYLPTPEHVAVATALAGRVKGKARVVVDPILGDDPKGLYLPERTAEALRDQLVPLADVLTPNRFELCWLSGRSVKDITEAVEAARGLGTPEVLVTSPPLGPDETGVLAVSSSSEMLWTVPKTDGVPHGTGDVFAALTAAGLTPGAALGALQALIGASLNAPHLRIAEIATIWRAAAPLPPKEPPWPMTSS